ncbi:TonB-dependent receptor [Flaviaesturariibacter flavus]|nr:carboxypeptidase regulatory-like domain-containing protein [Flaviaesturariibacter flavus]
MTGTIRDVAGATLTGATIQATHTPSGTRYSTSSQASGQYTINNMRSGGPYTVTITYVGYEQQRLDDIFVQLGEATVVNGSLSRSNATLEQVVVTSTGGRNRILSANRNGAVTNIGVREIQRMPSITRSINDLTRITPQANGTSIGGGNYRSNYITVDGSDFNNQFGIGTNLPANGSPISLDALGEISVSVTPYDIRQSGFTGAAVNAVTRSGTNNVEGSVYRYWRSEKQQGNKAGNVTFSPVPFTFDQFGARLGGPIVPNKLFFFLSYEQDNQPKNVQTRIASSPSAPFGSAPNIARPTREDLDMISSYLQNTYGYETGPYDNYSTQIERKKFLARLDWNINRNHRFNVRYNEVKGGEPNPPSTSRSPLTSFANGAGRTDINALWFKNSNYFQGANFYSFAAELNSNLGNRMTNVIRGTYTKQDDSRTTTSTDFPFVDILKDGSPYVSFGYEPFSKGNIRRVETVSVLDNFTVTKNRHSLLFGVQYERSKTTNGFQRFATSYYTFASWDDFISAQNANPALRKNPTDFGITYSLAKDFSQVFPQFEFAQYSAYAQDEITINPRFRLTLGLRADLPTYPNVSAIQTHPLVDSLTFPGGEKINTGNLPGNSVMFSPRLGFNWDVNGDRSFQVRGGTGIFTGRIPFVWIVSQSGDAGLLQITQTVTGAANTPGPFNPNPAAYLPATPPVAGTVVPSTITALAPNFKFPQTWKTSLAVDRRLGKGWVLSLEGIFNKDLNTAIFRNPNLVAPQPLNVNGYPDNRLIYPNATPDKFVFPLTSSVASQASPLRPSYPVASGNAKGTQAFNPIVIDNGSQGYSAYFTLKAEKQFSNNWYATVAYTKAFGANLFDGSGDQPLSAWQGTANVNGSNSYGLDYNGNIIPDRVVASVSYRKEYLKHLGTTISLFYEGGIQGRYSYTYNGDINRDGTNNDLIYIPRDKSEIDFVSKTLNGVTYSADQQEELFFRFIDQDPYLRNHKGQYAERNGAKLPWRNQFDLRIMQDVFTNIGKNRNSIQVSLDIFNVGNLLNSSWGVFRQTNATSPLVVTNQASLVPGGSVRPTFQLATDRQGLLLESFRTNTTITSTYYMQFGLRYIFGN